MQGPSGRRYTEPSSLKIHSGVELGQDPAADDLAVGESEGALDVDLAELSLGQRLTAVSGGDQAAQLGGSSESESEEDGSPRQPNGKSRKSKGAAPDSVPASSLTRTLIQAIHSSDSRLLETCLSHSDPLLIRSTVRKLPPQLAVPLLTACVDRLGRGHRAANMKGGGGGASSQRGISLMAWVKVVLTVHSGHLMTVSPDLMSQFLSSGSLNSHTDAGFNHEAFGAACCANVEVGFAGESVEPQWTPRHGIVPDGDKVFECPCNPHGDFEGQATGRSTRG